MLAHLSPLSGWESTMVEVLFFRLSKKRRPIETWTMPWVLVLLFLLTCSGSCLVLSAEEEFSEELLLRPLPDGKLLTHFQFTNEVPLTKLYGHHHRLFPKAVYQLVHKFQIREMEISFTQGRWNYDRWGGIDPVAGVNAKPSGVEMWAVFAVPDAEIDATWRNLTHALSGLFCASLNFLESPSMIANPVYTFRPREFKSHFELNRCDVATADVCCPAPETQGEEVPGRVRYGALPREAVCTENLTPWLKLLPCRDKAGLASLLDRPMIYKSWYHSLRLYVKCNEFEPHIVNTPKGTFLQQTLTVVTQPSDTRSAAAISMQPSWSLLSLFGKHLPSGCPLAKSSAVYVELEGVLVEKLNQLGVDKEWTEGSFKCNEKSTDGAIPESDDMQTVEKGCLFDTQKQLKIFTENDVYALRGVPTSLLWESKGTKENHPSILLVYSVPRHSNIHRLDVGMLWKVPFTWTLPRAPFRATRFLIGSGNARGSIAIVLKSNSLHAKRSREFGEIMEQSGSMDVMVFQIVPWYIRLYLHTLKVLIDDQPMPFQEVVKWMQAVPSEDRISPGVIELDLRIPSNATVVTLITDFDKGFLRIDEHPPDANRGFDLPSALISFPHERCERYYQLVGPGNIETEDSPLLKDFQRTRSMQIYTEVLLIPLATPDFSMPYNVITLTCTVLALYFGSLLNILRRRIGEEERLAGRKEGSSVGKLERLLSKVFVWRHHSKNMETSPSKGARVLKFILVAGIGVVLHYYLTTT